MLRAASAPLLRLHRPQARRSLLGQLSGRRLLSTTFAPEQVVESVLTAVHVQTGAPWWLAIGGSAIAFRIALLPLVRLHSTKTHPSVTYEARTVLLQVRFQVLETRRLVALRPQLTAMRAKVCLRSVDPGEVYLTPTLPPQCASIQPTNARAWAMLQGLRRCCAEADVRPGALLAATFAPIPLLLIAIIAVRRAQVPDAPLARELREGGVSFGLRPPQASPRAQPRTFPCSPLTLARSDSPSYSA